MDRRDFIKATGTGMALVLSPLGSRAQGPLSADGIESRIREILSQLTLEEKVSQMSGTKKGSEISPDYWNAQTPGIKRLGIPGMRFTDGPKGINREGSTAFPVAIARGAAWDVELAERVGEAMGYEARAQGANMYGGVCINVLRHPANGRAQESFGEDPLLLGAMGVATIRGVQKHVAACAKHFACNNHEESRFYVNVIVDERTLREVYLPHFKACVDAGVASIMSAYNNLNGHICSENRHLLTEILKEEWGFPGFVMSDFGMGTESTLPAAKAGLDVEMDRTVYFGKRLIMAVRLGLLPEAVIDQAVARILRQKLRFIHLEDVEYDKSKLAGAEHAVLSRESARHGMVLLKNDKGLLPLDPGKMKKVAVLGELADKANIGDIWSSGVKTPYVVTPLEGIKARLGEPVEVVYNDGRDLATAKAVARGAEAVIVVAGLTAKDEGEGGFGPIPVFQYLPMSETGRDRGFLGLHDWEVALINAVSEETDRLVVVLEGGAAITLREWKDRAQAILMAWYPGMEGGHAVADVLFGDFNPCGKLPCVWPVNEEQCVPLDTRAATVNYGYLHGYRYQEKMGYQPEFPFGFGLSYTTFRYSNLRLDRSAIGGNETVTALVDVTNTGKVAGREVAQLYVSYPGSAVERAPKDLKAFAKVALEPGATKTVALTLNAKDLAYYDAAASKWVVENIEYEVKVGPSADDDDLLAERFRVKG
jgi:beta-glucosidase